MTRRLLISAAHKSSGKTTLSIGLCAALARKGLAVQPFKKGPDYIDPMWLGRAAKNPCYNLDFYTMSHQEIIDKFSRSTADCDISIIEGNKGLYDGLDLDGSNSNAALATLLKTPVVLVIDVQGMTRGVAPLILGYQAFDPNIYIAGVILNQVRGQRHESKLRQVIEHYTKVPVIGSVAHDRNMQITERHLGLVPSNEQHEVDQKIEYIAERVSQQVDLDKLIEIATTEQNLESGYSAQSACQGEKIRLGIARDEAFGFYYPDDLQALENAGAELININMLEDNALPELDGLFIGGGFPETQMAQLEANESMRNSVRKAIESGLPVYAECGGLMYLARSIEWNDRKHEMVGVIPADITMHARPQGRGYIRLAETADCLWPMAGKENQELPAHEFHYSALNDLPEDSRFAYRVVRGTGIDGKHDGFVYKNLLACYAHLRHTRQTPWTSKFIQFIRSRKSGN